jgi:hypothetical protein
VVALWQAQRLLQGNHCTATQGSNEGELARQIPMLQEVAAPFGGKKQVCDLC